MKADACVSDPLSSPEGNRGATPTWDPSFSYRLRRSRTRRGRHDEQPVGTGELYRDRSIGRILRSRSQKCQRIITRTSATNVTDNSGVVTRLSSRGRRRSTACQATVTICALTWSNPLRRLYRWAVLAAARVLCWPRRRSAQYKPRPMNDPATGENVPHRRRRRLLVPDRRHRRRQRGSGRSGTHRHADRPQARSRPDRPAASRCSSCTLRPARSHKFRFQYIPINYTQTTTLNTRHRLQRAALLASACRSTRRSTGRRTASATSSTSSSKNRGFAGFILEAKYTDVQRARSPARSLSEFAQRARRRFRRIGGIGRFYVVPNISITGEVTGFKLPDSIDKPLRRRTTSTSTSTAR